MEGRLTDVAPPSRTDWERAIKFRKGSEMGKTGRLYSPKFKGKAARLLQSSGGPGKQPEDRACTRCGEQLAQKQQYTLRIPRT